MCSLTAICCVIVVASCCLNRLLLQQEKMTTHLELTRAVFWWVVRNVSVPRDGAASQSINAPLFAAEQQVGLEDSLLYGTFGTWSERVAVLFVSLAKACHLEAVTVSGYWRTDALFPGATLGVHNHCWNAVKVNGKWRLLDCTHAAMEGGHVAFFSAPHHFRITHQPLNAPWSLMRDYISNDDFFAQPWIRCCFLNAGGRVVTHGLPAVTRLRPPQQGSFLPVATMALAIPPTHSCAPPLPCPAAHAHGLTQLDEWGFTSPGAWVHPTCATVTVHHECPPGRCPANLRTRPHEPRC
jgi:hypothetical protein